MDCTSIGVVSSLSRTTFVPMQHRDAICIIISSISFVLIVATALPSILVMLKRVGLGRTRGHASVQSLYEDEDGIATEESQEQCFVKLPRHLVLASTVLGALMSLASSISSSIHPNEEPIVLDWMTSGSWVDFV